MTRRNPRAGESEWIIDETVYVVHEVATGLVRTDPRWAADRLALLRESLDTIFGGRPTFLCCWTYLSAVL